MLFFDALAAALLAAPANDEVFFLIVLLVLLVAPNPLICKEVEDVVGGDLLVVSAEVEANKFVLAELIESFTPADDVLLLPPKLNPPPDDLSDELEGLESIPPNPAKGNEGASLLLLVDVTPLKSDLGNKFLDDDSEALSPEGNDAPKDEPNILISIYILSSLICNDIIY